MTMLEKVARALAYTVGRNVFDYSHAKAATFSDEKWKDYIADSRAAIEAMRPYLDETKLEDIDAG